MKTVSAFAAQDAHVIYGTAYDESLVDEIRVTVVATGLNRQGARRAAPPLQVIQRTGTDNLPVQQVQAADGAVGASYEVPSVWRNNRNQAAAKVDALAAGGMDDFEIPAFLRRQAD